MRHARFEDPYESVDFLPRPLRRHDFANEFDELIVGQATRAHNALLVIGGVQHGQQLPTAALACQE